MNFLAFFGKQKKTKNVFLQFCFQPLVKIIGKGSVMYKLKDSDKVNVTLNLLDEVGNTVPKPEGVTPVWTASDDLLLTLTPDSSGMSCIISADGPLGTSQVNVSVTLPDGKDVVGLLDVEIIPGDITIVNLNPGTPEHK